MASRNAASLLPPELTTDLFNRINRLAKSESHARWYMKRVEEYLATNRRRPVSRHTADDITRWFSELGRKKSLNEWQFRQCVEAVGMLMRVAGAPSLKEVDWEFWLAGGKALEPAHPTTGRNNSPITVSDPLSSTVTAVSGNDLLADFVRAIRIEGLAYKTEQSYRAWIKRYLSFCCTRGLAESEPASVRQFLDYLVLERDVASSTQNQALNALVFLYRNVWKQELGELDEFTYSKRPKRLPTVLTRQEVQALLSCMKGRNSMIASLLYGTGMRLMEALRLRVQDIDFGYRQILVRNGKGGEGPGCTAA
ncbi:tyrosine-type recombinase/integrase [Halomonas alkaliantarctica]|nr:tyrosine-type recombinase/integrase [Halomonas alkaliantarctica]